VCRTFSPSLAQYTIFSCFTKLSYSEHIATTLGGTELFTTFSSMMQLCPAFKIWLQSLVRKAVVRPNVVENQTEVSLRDEDRQPNAFSKTHSQGWSLKLSEGERLCSVCRKLGQLPLKKWDGINRFHEPVVQHHYTVGTLLASARGGCHFCSLLVEAWQKICVLSQDSDGHWVGKSRYGSAVLDGRIKLGLRRYEGALPSTGFQVDGVHITIKCGNLAREMSGHLICYPADGGLYVHPQIIFNL
jgi:hypothetical protein